MSKKSTPIEDTQVIDTSAFADGNPFTEAAQRNSEGESLEARHEKAMPAGTSYDHDDGLGANAGTFTNIKLPDSKAAPNPLEPRTGENVFDVVCRTLGIDKTKHKLHGPLQTKTWNGFYKNPAGEGTYMTMYSYSGKFVEITPMAEKISEDLTRLRKRFDGKRKKYNSSHRTLGTGLGTPVTYMQLFSDWQLGKDAMTPEDPGIDGLEQTVFRVERAVEESKQRIKDMKRRGVNIERIAIGHLGDPIENVADSYANQQFLIDYNLKDQITHALDLMEWTAGELLFDADLRSIFGVLCNHGQLARRGTKGNVTDEADNAQNLLLELLRDKIISPKPSKFSKGPTIEDVDWYLPGKRAITTLQLSGVNVAAAHGHKITGTMDKWMAAQNSDLVQFEGFMPKLWVVAHRHSLAVGDFGPYSYIQAPTTDGGSEYFRDMTGKSSTAGSLSMLVGQHHKLGWSDLQLTA